MSRHVFLSAMHWIEKTKKRNRISWINARQLDWQLSMAEVVVIIPVENPLDSWLSWWSAWITIDNLIRTKWMRCVELESDWASLYLLNTETFGFLISYRSLSESCRGYLAHWRVFLWRCSMANGRIWCLYTHHVTMRKGHETTHAVTWEYYSIINLIRYIGIPNAEKSSQHIRLIYSHTNDYYPSNGVSKKRSQEDIKHSEIVTDFHVPF